MQAKILPKKNMRKPEAQQEANTASKIKSDIIKQGADELAPYFALQAKFLKREKLEILARQHPEVAELLAELDAMKKQSAKNK